MDTIINKIIEQYGLIGVTTLFSGWMIHKILTHFMTNVENKDKQVVEISAKFSSALEENTKALYELSKSQLKMSDASESVVLSFDRMAEQNRQEHAQILTFGRRAAL